MILVNGDDFAESSINYVPYENKTLVANFNPKNYKVSLNYDAIQGLVTGYSSPLYSYKSMLTLTALPNTDYDFVGWKVNDVDAGINTTLNLEVTKDFTIVPVFKSSKVTTAIPDLLGQNRLFMNVYPNPSNKGIGVNVEVSIPENEIKGCELEVTSLLGSIVKVMPLTSNKIHVSDIASGMYIFRLKSTNSELHLQKVIIQ